MPVVRRSVYVIAPAVASHASVALVGLVPEMRNAAGGAPAVPVGLVIGSLGKTPISCAASGVAVDNITKSADAIAPFRFIVMMTSRSKSFEPHYLVALESTARYNRCRRVLLLDCIDHHFTNQF